MIWLILAAVAFAAVLLWMLIETRSTLHLLWVTPLCIGLIVGTHSWAYSMFGYPTDIYDQDQEFTLISYHVPNEEDKIVVWVVLSGEDTPKAIVIPYNPEDEEGLQNIAEKMAAGQRFLGRFGEAPPEDGEGEDGDSNEENAGGSNKSTGGMLNFHELTVESFLPPKDYIKEKTFKNVQ